MTAFLAARTLAGRETPFHECIPTGRAPARRRAWRAPSASCSGTPTRAGGMVAGRAVARAGSSASPPPSVCSARSRPAGWSWGNGASRRGAGAWAPAPSSLVPGPSGPTASVSAARPELESLTRATGETFERRDPRRRRDPHPGRGAGRPPDRDLPQRRHPLAGARHVHRQGAAHRCSRRRARPGASNGAHAAAAGCAGSRPTPSDRGVASGGQGDWSAWRGRATPPPSTSWKTATWRWARRSGGTTGGWSPPSHSAVPATRFTGARIPGLVRGRCARPPPASPAALGWSPTAGRRGPTLATLISSTPGGGETSCRTPCAGWSAARGPHAPPRLLGGPSLGLGVSTSQGLAGDRRRGRALPEALHAPVRGARRRGGRADRDRPIAVRGGRVRRGNLGELDSLGAKPSTISWTGPGRGAGRCTGSIPSPGLVRRRRPGAAHRGDRRDRVDPGDPGVDRRAGRRRTLGRRRHHVRLHDHRRPDPAG